MDQIQKDESRKLDFDRKHAICLPDKEKVEISDFLIEIKFRKFIKFDHWKAKSKKSIDKDDYCRTLTRRKTLRKKRSKWQIFENFRLNPWFSYLTI